MSYTPRDYQIEVIDKVIKSFKHGRSTVLVLPTGGGKTVTFGFIVERASLKMRCLIVVHRKDLRKQIENTFNEMGIDFHTIKAGDKKIPEANIYTSTTETIYNRKNLLPEIGLMVSDEGHNTHTNKLSDIPTYDLGVTATPLSSNKRKPLKDRFENIVIGRTVNELINSGDLEDYKHYAPKVDVSKLKIKNGEFSNDSLMQVYDTKILYKGVIKAYERLSLGKKTKVFNCNIEHSKKTTQEFINAGYNAKHVDSKMSEEDIEQTLIWYKNTPDAILNSVGKLTEGFDEPSIECVILNRATTSLSLYHQMCGRGSRPFKGKKGFILIDLGRNIDRFGFWNGFVDWEYIFNNPDKVKEKLDAASTKECKNCGLIMYQGERICPVCKHEQPVKEKELIEAELQIEESKQEVPVDCGTIDYYVKLWDYEQHGKDKKKYRSYLVRKIYAKWGDKGLIEFKNKKNFKNRWVSIQKKIILAKKSSFKR